jgi:hypothetical protein
MGGVAMLVGLVIAVFAVSLGVNGWQIDRLWFYLLASALSFLAGIQLFIYWLLLRTLDEINQREILTKQDMGLE